MKINKSILGVVAMATLLGACNDRELKELSNQAYIAQTGTQAGRLGSLQLGDSEVSTDINVRLSNPQDKDQSYSLELSSEALEQYNKLNGTAFVMLPAEQVKLSTTNVVVKAGAVFSEAVKVSLQPLSKEQMDSGKKFAVAFKLKSAGASAAVLKGADTYVYAIKTITSAYAPILGTYKGKYYKAIARGIAPVELQRFTIEMRVNINGLNKNNQALFGAWAPGSEIYMRFGDANPPYDYLNIKFGDGGQIDRTFEGAKTNTWYHIALVFDGSQATLYVNGSKITSTDKPAGRVFKLNDAIHVAGSGSAWFINACIFSELRIWNTARTLEQLRDNEYTVDPTTPGLLHYWKMNEGKGGTFANSVAGAPALNVYDESYDVDHPENSTIQTPVWVSNVRSDGKGTVKVP